MHPVWVDRVTYDWLLRGWAATYQGSPKRFRGWTKGHAWNRANRQWQRDVKGRV